MYRSDDMNSSVASMTLSRLANQLNGFGSSFSSTRFVFVPGPDDPCLNIVGFIEVLCACLFCKAS